MDTQPAYNRNDEIDLILLVKVLFRRKWMIIGGTALITIIALLAALMLPKGYKSTGFFKLSRDVDFNLEEVKEIQKRIREDLQEEKKDNLTLQNTLLLEELLGDNSLSMQVVTIPEYKKYLSLFTNPHQFLGFVEWKGEKANLSLQDLRESIRTTEDIEQWFEAEYAYSKRELKDLTQNSRDLKNFVLGIHLYGEHNSPEKAHAFVTALGGFIKNVILSERLGEYIRVQTVKSSTHVRKYANYIIKDQFKLEQLKAKQAKLEKISNKYPQARSMAQREVLSLENNGYRYLSPVAQLVGIHSHVADIEENLQHNLREKAREELKLEFLESLKKPAAKPTFGEPLLQECIGKKNTFFTAREGIPTGILKQAENEFSVDLNGFGEFRDKMEFISGPTMPRRPIKPKKNLIVAIGFLLGLLLSICLAFFVDWWLLNKKKIVSTNNNGKES